MAIPTIARQYPLYVFVDMDFNDWGAGAALTAVDTNLFSIPLNSVLVFTSVVIETAFAAASTYDCDFGDDSDPNRYSQTIVEFDAVGTPTNDFDVDTSFLTTSAEPTVTFRPTFTTDPTAGEARILVEYVTEGKANETDG